MKTNLAVSAPKPKSHEGGVGEILRDPLKQLERTVATCLLFENTFYEGGDSIANRIAELCKQVPQYVIGELAVKARNDFKLRHVPLWLMVHALRRPYELRKAPSNHFPVRAWTYLSEIIQRPDELGEFIALYLKAAGKAHICGTDSNIPLSAQAKRGLAAAFGKFNEYQLAKWNKDSAAFSLLDVMRLVHPRPNGPEQAALWGRLVKDELAPPDTWERALTEAHNKAEKKAVWERLLSEKKLADMAFLMNLRNMTDVGVDRALIEQGLKSRKFSKILPFRFVAASKAAPHLAQELSDAMVRALAGVSMLSGTTYLIVDVSGSMDVPIRHRKSTPTWNAVLVAQRGASTETTRMEAAGALAVLLRETGSSRTFTFSQRLVEVQNLRGLGLMSGIRDSQQHGGTMLSESLSMLKDKYPDPDRIIVITDEQTHDGSLYNWAKGQSYIVNVAPYAVGVQIGGNGWQRINGWSERIVDWIGFEETGKLSGPSYD